MDSSCILRKVPVSSAPLISPKGQSPSRSHSVILKQLQGHHPEIQGPPDSAFCQAHILQNHKLTQDVAAIAQTASGLNLFNEYQVQ